MHDLPQDVATLIDAAAARHGLAPELVRGVAWVESRGKQDGPPSSKGAIGVMQLMPDTAAGLGVDPRNLEQNIEGGTRFLAGLVQRFGKFGALAAYVWGPENVRLRKSWPGEVLQYVRAVSEREALEAVKLGRGPRSGFPLSPWVSQPSAVRSL